ncbi:DUF3810 domain-containing protein [Haloplasma contractile]|uniref:DUF3810 domain-containing protein n=1 Tax=Haloplasma contractile SSD-17B TaxID=1033810 RepID=F7Q110_9MOLU|nr:DUF3810 domain-containing protein [Haloplasma contractile]ERJ11347.1 hypothetical protein HLPCO_002649 [Haloplasma contractile SSD-17B]
MFSIIKRLIINLKSIIWPLVAMLVYFIGRSLENHSRLVEQFYSTTINKWVRQGISWLSGFVTFSISEILILLHVLAIPVIIVVMIKKFNKGELLIVTKKLLSYVSVMYILFMLLWGFNYSRQSITEVMNLEVKESSTEELYNLSKALILKANDLRGQVNEDSEGVMTIEGGYESVFERSDEGYKEVTDEYRVLSGSYGKPKPIMLSRPMLYTQIVGIYIPYTAEPNVNVATPDLQIPTNTLHEMAHQRGFAYEGEANYIAYLTATAHKDSDFRYSGTMFALKYTLNALLRDDYELGFELISLLSEDVKRDLTYINGFWVKYEGKASEVADTVNDTYLKGNGQEEGTKSYGQVVDLLLAHYRKYGEV